MIAGESRVERLVRRDRAVLLAALGALVSLASAWIAGGVGSGMSVTAMARGSLFPHLAAGGAVMPGLAMAPDWTILYFLTDAAMWWVMMAAMMLPATAPLILLHARTVRHGQRQGRIARGPVPSLWFLSGYLSVWLGFSLIAAALHFLLARLGLVSAMMMWSQSRWLSAGLLVLAAAFRLPPGERACLSQCRRPVDFLAAHWRPGRAGAFRMGLDHGFYCLGCSWALMLLLFVGGAMNLVWIAMLGVLVLTERLAPFGARTPPATGALLGLWAAATLFV